MNLWVTAVDNPTPARVLPNVRLFAVMGTWLETDIVAATVQNALAQGCERVYLVDNASPDGTVAAAIAAGAILARSYATPRYDESLRLLYMNEVVAQVSAAEPDDSIWWLFLDADEFPHGPSGLTLLAYLRTLDQRFRVVGCRCFEHYPDRMPAYTPGSHPLDCQPMCEELALPMCGSGHRKHSLIRYDRSGSVVRAGNGFHIVECEDALLEPAQPAFLHHFPYREEAVTRQRLDALWLHSSSDVARADESRDTHMLARQRSLQAVYGGEWHRVVNFVALDPISSGMSTKPPEEGVTLRNWVESVAPEHVPVARWYSMLGAWRYSPNQVFSFGDDVTYRKGIDFLDGHGTIEDWGCGFGKARDFVRVGPYIGIDGSSPHAEVIADLCDYRSDVPCIFMRHVLEHNIRWHRILANAVASFRFRMALVLFTPFASVTRQIATSTVLTSVPVPDIAFSPSDLSACFDGLRVEQETLRTNTQYGVETVFYLQK